MAVWFPRLRWDRTRAAGSRSRVDAPPSSPPGRAATFAVLDIVLPVFGLVLMGYAAAKSGSFDDGATRGLSLFVFNYAIPLMLTRTLAQAALPADPEWRLLFVYFGATFATFALAFLAARRLFSLRGAAPAIFGITAGFSNTIILGIPLILQAYPKAAAVPLFLIIAFHSPLILTVTTSFAEAGLGAGLGLRRLLLSIGRGLVTNPILWGLAAGLALNLTHLSLPGVLDRLIGMIGGAALPCALFALGANLSRFRVAGALREALLLSALKTVAHPLLVLCLSWALGLSPLARAVALTIAACPAGVNPYLFAARYEVAVAEVSSTILISTVISVLTLSLVLAHLHG